MSLIGFEIGPESEEYRASKRNNPHDLIVRSLDVDTILEKPHVNEVAISGLSIRNVVVYVQRIRIGRHQRDSDAQLHFVGDLNSCRAFEALDKMIAIDVVAPHTHFHSHAHAQ